MTREKLATELRRLGHKFITGRSDHDLIRDLVVTGRRDPVTESHIAQLVTQGTTFEEFYRACGVER
jgi:hypothetical protein